MIKDFEIRKRRDFGAILGDTLQFAFKNWREFLQLYIVYAVPFFIISFGLILLLDGLLKEWVDFQDIDQVTFSLSSGLSGLFSIIPLIIFSIAVMAFCKGYHDNSIDEYEENWWAICKSIMKQRFMAAVLTGAALFLIVVVILAGPIALLTLGTPILGVLLFLLFMIAVIYLAIRWIFATYASMDADEGIRISNYFKRSTDLVEGKWWITFFLNLLVSFIVGILGYIFALPATILSLFMAFNPDSSFADFWVYLIHLFQYVFSTFLQALSICAIVIMYYSYDEEKYGKTLVDDIENFENLE